MVHKKDAKDWAREHLRGIWTSPTIPFNEDFSLNEAGIRHNVNRMIEAKAGGLGFGFSEPWVCSLAERKRGMDVSLDAINKRVPAYLHTTDHSVEESVNLTRYAEAIGADAVMIWTPFEWGKNQDMIVDYFEYVASKTDIAIFAYNTWHSGISMEPETVARLARIPNICALKDAVNDVSHTVRCMELAGKEIVISDPLEDHLLTMTLQFGQQVMLGTTSVFLMQTPDCQPIYEYFDLARNGHAAEASRKYYELQPLRECWTSMYQSLWNKKGATHPLPFIKHWMDLIGMAGGPVRPPMHQLTAEQKAELAAKLEASNWMDRLMPARRTVA